MAGWQRGQGVRIPEAVRLEVLGRLRAGSTWSEVMGQFEVSRQTVWRWVREAGGMPAVWPNRSAKCLSLDDREEISRGLVAGESFASIARRLGRSTSTVSREVNNNGGRDDYRAASADRSACQRARRPKSTKLEQNAALRMFVENGLEANWSPEEICGRLLV